MLLASGLLIGGAYTEAQLFNPSTAICLHGADESQANRTRRIDALSVARTVNAAEAEMARRTRRYAPLATLAATPAVPSGFDVQFYASTDGYLLALKDSRDPCRYAIFSDPSGHLYESSSAGQIANP